MQVLEVLSVLGVLTTGAVIAFTGEFVDRAVYIHNTGRCEHDENIFTI